MIHIYKILTILLITGLTACMSPNPNIMAGNDEDQDIGLGGTGLVANSGSGLGGTGIVGVITGFGSIFVNGIEVEYDHTTPFTIDGKPAEYQQLVIGDVVEVLTTNNDQHTDAQIINVRHEVMGKVKSVNPETYSFKVLDQTIVHGLNNGPLPEVGASVAISGFRINDKMIQATRVHSADTNKAFVRTQMKLPFSKKTSRWLVQTHVQNGQVVVQFNKTAHILDVSEKVKLTKKDQQGVRILKLQKSTSGQILMDKTIDPVDMPKGRLFDKPVQQPGGNMRRRPMNNFNNMNGVPNMHRGGR